MSETYAQERRQLSSDWTVFYKYIFPAFWIVGFGIGTLALWLGEFDEPEPEQWMKTQFLLMWIAGSTFLLWFGRRLKDVWLEGNDLVVSGSGQMERIPLTAVEEVKETWLWNPKMIKIRLRRPGAFGDRITFVAPYRIWPFSRHPVVTLLRERARLNG